MSSKEFDGKTGAQDLQWVACMGDFVLLKDLLSKKRHSFPWMVFGFFDALFRGFGQVVFANNPISGIIIMIGFASSVAGTLVAGAGTGFLGLLLSLVSAFARIRCTGRCNSSRDAALRYDALRISLLPHSILHMLAIIHSFITGYYIIFYSPSFIETGNFLLRDTRDNIGNGLTVYNPLLIGSVTHALAPNFYGDLDAFVILMTIVGAIFRFPCITVPFNVAEIVLLLILTMQRDFGDVYDGAEIVNRTFNESGNTTVQLSPLDGLTNETFTTEKLNWGMVFRGVVTSASQVYAVDDVAAGSVIYLGIVVYSPLTALFSFLGALIGSLAALGLRVPYAAVYAGLWGYNSLLTGAAFGGLFIVMSGQTGAAALVAIIFTTFFQYALEPLMAKLGLPVLTIPFVVTAWLFFGLRDSIDGSFPRPSLVTFPENELHDFLSKRHARDLYTVEDGSDPEIPSNDEKKTSND